MEMFILIKSSMLNMLEDDSLLVFCAIFHYFVILWHMMPPVLLFCSIHSICLTSSMAIYCTYVSFMLSNIAYLMVSYISAFSRHYHFKSKTLQDVFSPEPQKEGVRLRCLLYLWRRSLIQGLNRVIGSEVGWRYPKPSSVAGTHGFEKHWKTGSTNGAMTV